MIRKIAFVLFTLPFALICQAQAPRSYTSSEILLQLKKLNTVGSVLYIAAHPDDENTRLIAYLANEKCLRTGYLSLTRGDGGQNLIGPEQGIELGVIRTQELLAARRIDGGEQFFTRAYDFGFSKTPEETFTKWEKDSILADVVWVIRNFRPDIIITRFATDGSGGHGHHTASAILAEEAFDAAADPNRFPEQLNYVSVWKTRRMFYNTVARFRDPNADMSAYIPLDVGGYNALLGKSYGEISAESRSMHKSQGFGSARQRGEMMEHFKPVKGDTAGLKDIFDGMDFSWKRIKGGEKAGSAVARTITRYKQSDPQASVSDMLSVIAEIERVPGASLAYKMTLANSILQNMSGLVVDATVSESNITTGSRQKLAVNVIARSSSGMRLEKIQLGGALFNSTSSIDTFMGKTLTRNVQLPVTLPSVYGSSDAISQHYNLRKPIRHSMFDIGDLDYRSAPEIFVNSSGTARFSINNQHVNVPFLFRYKWVDPSKGELYRPLVITPPVMINVMNEVLTFSGEETKELKITIEAGRDSVEGRFHFTKPRTWAFECAGDDVTELFIDNSMTLKNDTVNNIAYCTFKLARKGEKKTYTIRITPGKDAQSLVLQPYLSIGDEVYTKGIREIRYDHIPVQTMFPEAEVKLVKLDVKKKLKRIGYIPGAGDEVQNSLSQLGYEVITLTDDKLANESLGQYEAIVTGVRAYNTNDKLPSFRQKLMDYVAAGGNLVVQYNTNSWAGPLSSEIGPYPFKITRDRVTDEDAKVNFELPDHPVLNIPNKITAKDFEGWVQERSIYHASDWSSVYDTPISMADPGEKTNKGALIIAKHGKGHFIYTGLVFFRELPAGVPGAYRLMVNLIELGK